MCDSILTFTQKGFFHITSGLVYVSIARSINLSLNLYSNVRRIVIENLILHF